MTGELILVSNDLGNAQDLSPRALQTWRQADLLVFESDRGARRALKAAGIFRPFCTFSEHGEASSLEEVRNAWRRGQTVAYASDHGSPGVCDPGFALCRLALSLGVRLRVIPGPSSLGAILALCPWSMDSFFFAGFLPRDGSERRTRIQELDGLGVPLVILDTPYRRHTLLQAAAEILGPTREVLLGIDLGGTDEDVRIGSLEQILASSDPSQRPDQPFVLAIAAGQRRRPMQPLRAKEGRSVKGTRFVEKHAQGRHRRHRQENAIKTKSTSKYQN